MGKRAGKCRYRIESEGITIGFFFKKDDRDYALFRYFQAQNRPGIPINLS
jgi:hypothetical protein